MYLIQSGKVGVYSIVNSKQVIRNIYIDGYIVNGYNPTLEYKPLLTTAIALEDSIINIIKKDQLIEMMYKNKSSKINFVKMTSLKVNNAILKIKALKNDKLQYKLIIIIYSILKMKTLFNKNAVKLTLSYTIEDIKNILNLNLPNEEIYKELKNIKYIEVDSSFTIKITNIKN